MSSCAIQFRITFALTMHLHHCISYQFEMTLHMQLTLCSILSFDQCENSQRKFSIINLFMHFVQHHMHMTSCLHIPSVINKWSICLFRWGNSKLSSESFSTIHSFMHFVQHHIHMHDILRAHSKRLCDSNRNKQVHETY